MRTIAITGGKGGTGKSNTAINLGMALNQYKKDVIIVDANLTTPDIGIYLGNPINPVTLHDVLKGKKHIKQAIYNHHSGTKIIPASLSIEDLKNTNPNKLKSSINDLVGTIDFVLIDGAAGLGNEAISAIKASDEIIIVTNPELPSISDALKTIKVSESLNIPVKGVIITRVKGNGLEMPLKEIEEMLEKQTLAIIPEDNAVKEALMRRDAVLITNPKAPVSIAYKKLAASLAGKRYSERLTKSKKSFFEKKFPGFGLQNGVSRREVWA